VDKIEYIKLAIWAGVIGIAFLFLWRKGFLAKITLYIQQTREELRKCTWPTTGELKGSTVVVMISVVLLGAFTVGVDFVFALFVRLMTQI